jgi:Flp pilus assembly protein TadD
MFLHIGLLHLCLNAAALASIGPAVERDYGPLGFVAIYLAAGLVGGVASMVWHRGAPVVSTGASGALCGAIAAGAVHALRSGPSRRSELRVLASWAVTTLAFGVIVRADNAAHVGGLAAGALLGGAFPRRARGRAHGQLPALVIVGVVVSAFSGSVLTRDRADTASALINAGVDLETGGDLEGAIAAYRRAVTLEPGDAVAHYDLGLALERQKEWAGALHHLGRALELERSARHETALAGAHVNHGVTLSEAGDVQAAIAAYRRALVVQSDNPSAHRNLGLALGQTGDRVAALVALRRAVELEPTPRTKSALASVLSADGAALARGGDHIEAVKRYREAIGFDPTEWHLHYNLGLSLLAQGDAAGAVTALEQARELEDSEEVRRLLATAMDARRDARADAGDLSGALDDLGAAALMRLAPRPDAGP